MSALTWSDIAQGFIAIAALYGAWRGHRNSAQIQEVHLSINSRMDQLLKSSAAAAHAAGVEQERDKK